MLLSPMVSVFYFGQLLLSLLFMIFAVDNIKCWFMKKITLFDDDEFLVRSFIRTFSFTLFISDIIIIISN